MLAAVGEWEARNARSLREREARARRELEQEELLTYTREDACGAVRVPGGARAAHASWGFCTAALPACFQGLTGVRVDAWRLQLEARAGWT